MKTIDNWFNESIEQYQQFTARITGLRERIDFLPLNKIVHQCEAIREVQEGIAERDEKLYEIMAFVGVEVLENPLIGEYQRALEAAIRETDRIASKVQNRKNLLLQEVAKLEKLKKGVSEYITGKEEHNGLIQ